jgi:hypothetical protein
MKNLSFPNAYMGSRTIILTKSGRHEHQSTVYVPDPSGFENSQNHKTRVIQFLNAQYGFDGWRDIEPTAATTSARNAIAAAEHTQKRFGQLDMIRRRAKNREKKIDKLNKR